MKFLFVSTLAFTLFFAVYAFLLRRLTFFGLNRAYLLFSLVFSFFLPFLSLDLGPWMAGVLPVVSLSEVVVRPGADPALQPVLRIVIWVYWIGATVAALLVIRSVVLILRNRSGAVLRSHPISDYLLSEGHHAFSFFDRIHIGRAVDPQLREMILAHEHVHQRQWHSMDVLCFALARVVWWFNPIIHLAAREVQLNHEFLADRETRARFGTDYQYSLLNQAMDTQFFPLGNSFFSQSLIKNRIRMMNKKNTRKRSLVFYALTLPLIAVSLWLHACHEQAGLPDSQQKLVELNDAVKASPTSYNAGQVDIIPEFPGGHEAMLTYFKDNFRYPTELKDDKVQGRVMISFVVNEDGTLDRVEAATSDDQRLEAPAVAFVKDMPNWSPGSKEGKAVKVKMMLPVQYRLD